MRHPHGLASPVEHRDGRVAAGGHTRWRIAAPASVAALVLVLALLQAVQQQVLATNFVLGGVAAHLEVPDADGVGLALYPDTVDLLDRDGRHVIRLGIDDGEVDGLCAILPIPTWIGRGFEVRATSPVTRATNLQIDTEVLRGDFSFEQIVIGRDASTFTEGPVRGPAGASGIQAATLDVTGLETSVLSVSATTFQMTGLRAEVLPRGTGC